MNRIYTIILLAILAPSLALAQRTQSIQGDYVNIDANKVISMCGEDSIRMATNCDTGTQQLISFADTGALSCPAAVTAVGPITLTGVASAVVGNGTNKGALINTGTVDGADSSAICINAGGACTGDFSRGGEIIMYGNESSSAGDVAIFGGATSGSNIRLSAGVSSGTITLENGGVAVVTVGNSSASFAQPIVTTPTSSIVRTDTSDGSDTKDIEIAGGGASGSSRGGAIRVFGNEGANPGRINLGAGDASGASVYALLPSGANNGTFTVRDSNTAVDRFTVAQSGGVTIPTGNLTVTSGTIINSNGSVQTSGTGAGFLDKDVATGLSAAGTTQGAGTAITHTVNEFTTITAASAEAATLFTPVVGQKVWIYNIHATAALKVFPASGGQICPGGGVACGATNAVFSLAAQKNMMCMATTTTKWYCLVA